jgi:hypothetical protein
MTVKATHRPLRPRANRTPDLVPAPDEPQQYGTGPLTLTFWIAKRY